MRLKLFLALLASLLLCCASTSFSYLDKVQDSHHDASLPVEVIDGQQNRCNNCSGTGVKICYRCKGTGVEGCGSCAGRGKTYSMSQGMWVTCRPCQGTGKVRCYHCHGAGGERCGVCHGRGVI